MQNKQKENSEVNNTGIAVSKKVLIGVGSILVVILLGLGIKYFYLQPQEEEANAELSLGLEYLAEGIRLNQQAISMLNAEDSTLTDSIKKECEELKKNATDKFNKALNGDGKYCGFIKLANKINIANAQAGICYFYLKDYKNAIKYLEELNTEENNILSTQYLKALADSYVCDKQVEKAIETLIQAAETSGNATQSSSMLLEAGILYESLNKKEDALNIYNKIKNDFPQSQIASVEINKYIERVSK